MKTLDEIRTLLARHREELAGSYKVQEIGIFGSYARGEQSSGSDLDVLVTFREPIGLFEFIDLENRLGELLGVKVDLVTKAALKPRIGARILSEVVRAVTAKREYLDYLQDIFESIGDIEVFVAGMDFERFASDKRTVNAVIRSLEVIGEAAKKIPVDISDAHPGVPWSKMCGMRDKLIHEYFGVDRTILWKVATEEIPPLKDVFRKILEEHW